jgi:preprotein translocase subunit SecA
MHQAIEAKEGVEIQNENQTLATITLQNYFRMYDTLSGMTGTAQTEAAELNAIYKLGVHTIPTNMPMIRADQADLVYRTEEAKYDAVVADIVERHNAGQPVLVGTISVEKSEYLSQQLRRHGVRHEVLNAKQHAREASIVADAGRKGAVTVATNMAGRGTDIMLGGNPEFRAVAALKAQGLDPEETPEAYEEAWDEALATAEEQVATEHDEVVELGGLYVLGTERHESRRIDNQLRGRSGRQGDPGESRFYLSLEDHLMRLFNAAMVDRFMTTAGMEDEVPIESKMVSRSIQSAQSQVEGQNYEIRKNVLKYDDVLNRQRQVIYDERRRVLEGEDMEEQIRLFVNDVIEGYVDSATAEGYAGDWDLEQLWTAMRTLYPVSITIDELADEAGGRNSITPEQLKEALTSDAHHAYDAREEALGAEVMREIERRVVMSVLDRKWREHLYEMDYLQEGIGLRAMAQRDPLVEYQREGFLLFEAMMDGIKEESVGYIFNVEVQVEQPALAGARDGSTQEAIAGQALEPVSVSEMLGGLAAETPQDAPSAAGVQDRQPVGASNGSNGAGAAGREPVPTGARVPPAFSAKGLGGPAARQLRYTAPSDDGSVEERNVSEDGATGAGSNGTPQARSGNRPPKRSSKKGRRRGK